MTEIASQFVEAASSALGGIHRIAIIFHVIGKEHCICLVCESST